MKKDQIQKGKWYHIHYEPSPNSRRKFIGAAKCVEIDFFPNSKKPTELMFVSPLNDDESFRRWMSFRARDVKRECDPLPPYEEMRRDLVELAKGIDPSDTTEEETAMIRKYLPEWPHCEYP